MDRELRRRDRDALRAAALTAAKQLDDGPVALLDREVDRPRAVVRGRSPLRSALQERAAELLGITFRSLRYRLEKLGMIKVVNKKIELMATPRRLDLIEPGQA